MNKITHNWAEHVAFGHAHSHFPASLAEVQAVVRQSPKLRPIGSRHGFNAIADTPGGLLSLRAMPRRIEIDAAARTVIIDGGITYAELSPVVDAAGWALFNLGSIPDFTVVGATATATHGSGNTNRNLAASVAALELVTASGDVLHVQRADADFDGAVVGLGALGVVTALTLDLVPRFDVRQWVVQRLPFERVVADFDGLMGSAYSVSLFTHWNGDFVDQVWLKALADAPPLPADFFGGTPATGPASPVIGRDPAGTTGQLGEVGPWYDRLTHARIGAIPQIGYEYQSEYFVARRHAAAAMRAIKTVEADLHPVLAVAEIRTVAGDQFWLSTNYGEDSVGFHFSWERDWPAVERALQIVEAALAPFAPRPHWGKLFVMPASTIQPLFPRLPDFRTLATRLDPDGKFRNAFIDTYVF